MIECFLYIPSTIQFFSTSGVYIRINFQNVHSTFNKRIISGEFFFAKSPILKKKNIPE